MLWGVGPRGGQSLIMAARARAALDGRPEVAIEDIQAMADRVLRHRMVLNYNAESQGQTPETRDQEAHRDHPRCMQRARQRHGRLEAHS